MACFLLALFSHAHNRMKSHGGNPMQSAGKKLPSEKRKHPRANIDLPIKYGKTNLFFKYARAANVSEGGLLVYLPEEMGIGQCLVLKLFLPSHSEFNTLEMSGQVVWMDPHLRKDRAWDYRTGVKFVDPSPENMKALRNFLVSTERKPRYTG